MLKIHALADTAAEVASTTKRNEKVAAFVRLLEQSHVDEVAVVVSFLIGEPMQGKVGLGWTTLDHLAGSGSGGTANAADLDELIDTVALTTGAGSQHARSELLESFGSTLNEHEATFVRRVLLGDMGQGALAGVVTSAVAKSAGTPVRLVRRAAMLLGSLPEAAAVAFRGGADALDDVQLKVGRAVQPMLASTATDVSDGLAKVDGLASVEWKLDGARVQVHRDGDQVRIYTRNLNDVTDRLPEIAELAKTFDSEAFVLDGEVLAMAAVGNSADPSPEAFQDTMSRFSSDGAVGASQLDAFFFDVLVADGTDVLDQPLRDRSAHLDRIVGEHRIPAIVTADVAEAQRHLDQALEQGHEGVMIKSIESTYEAGRRGTGWLKVKPVYTLDLVVLAAEWGHGRRTGTLSNLHLGARDPKSNELLMVGKTFKGLTDRLLAWQTTELLARKTHQEGITVHVRPELVVEIAVDGVQTSRRYPGGVALRFARVRGYRPDREPETADTIEAVRALR